MITKRVFIFCIVLLLLLLQLAGCSSLPFTQNCQGTIAIAKLDGNIYSYDLKRDCVQQLTFDGQPEPRGYSTETYYFFEPTLAWSSAHQSLLIGKNFQAYTLDRYGKITGPYGENVLSASWSPNGSKLLLVQAPFGQANMDYYPFDYNIITIIDLNNSKRPITFQGNGPTWIDDDKVVYFDVTGRSSDAFQYVYHDLNEFDTNTSKNRKLSATAQTYLGRSIRVSLLSPSKLNLAAYVPGGEYHSSTGILSLAEGGSSNITQSVTSFTAYSSARYSSKTSYRWSPTDELLALCSPVGTDDYIGPEEGALIFLRPHQAPGIFKDDTKPCLYGISWNPSGELVAFVGSKNQYYVHFFDVKQNKFLDEPAQSKEISDGLWWSPSGDMLGAISDKKVCLAKIEYPLTKLNFECIAEGSYMVWTP
jgi:hypothetical protein